MFLTADPKINYNIILENFDVIEQDYQYLKSVNKFYDYSSMDKLLNCPKDTGHSWVVSPLFYNKELWPTLDNDVKKLKTIELINSLNVKPILGTFSIMRPNSVIKDHEDHDEHCIAGEENTFTIKYHLGIEVAANDVAGLVVGGENSFIERKKLNVFNEGISHHAYNNSSADRGVLILSFLASDLR